MNKKIKKLILFGIPTIFLSLVFHTLTTAQEITVAPYLTISGEYNDNVFFSRQDEDDDYIFNFAPALKLAYKTELLDLESFASIQFKEYVDESDLSRDDQYFNFLGTGWLTARTRLRGRFYYLRDFTIESRIISFDETMPEPTDDELDQSVDPGIERFFSERQRYYGLGSLSHRLTELSELEFRYHYLKTDYDFEGNTDYDVNEISMIFKRRLEGQKDKIGAKVSYSQNSSDVSDSDSYIFSVLWDHRFTETMSLFTNIGIRYTDQDFKSRVEKSDNWNGIADVRLKRKGETNLAYIGFRQSLRTASNGRSVNVSRLYWESEQKILERLFFNLDGNFYVTREDSDSEFDEDSLFFDITPSLRYLLTEKHSLRIAYSYTYDRDKSLEGDDDSHRNRVWIVFELRFPKKW